MSARPVRVVETRVTARDPQRRASTSSTLSAGEFTLCGRSTAYGRHVSGAMENRAAVFTSQPQAVEVYQAGAWWAGELLGWRHDADGSCQVWVRVVLGGIEETAWTDLATLRLPERHLSVAAPASVRGPATQEMSVARHPSGRRPRSADVDPGATASMPKMRELSVVPDTASPATSTGGRRRAPEEAPASSGGRRRAPEDAPASSGGRRRAPEGAAASADAPSPAAPSPGRHRAAGDPGRHRTADTGLFPAVAQAPRPARPETAVGQASRPARPEPAAARVSRPARPEPAAASSRDAWTAPEGMEADLLTRPMRLSDHMQSRRPRLGGSLTH
jgi:hypothetical protein